MYLWLVLSLAGLAYYLYLFYSERRLYPPGPLPLPIIGNIHQLDFNGNIADVFYKFSQEYGPVFTVYMPLPMVFVTSYDVMKETFIKNGDAYAGRPQTELFKLFTGGNYGVILSEGPLWKEQRRFALHTLRDFGFGKNVMEEKIMAQASKLMDAFQEAATSGTLFNPRQPTQLCVANIIGDVILGRSYDDSQEELTRLRQVLDQNMSLMFSPVTMLLERIPALKHVPLFNNFNYKTLMRNRDDIYGQFNKDIREHEQRFNNSLSPIETVFRHAAAAGSAGQADDFCAAFLRERQRHIEAHGDEGFYGTHQLCTVLFDFWVAGMETTMTTLLWALLYLLHYPDVQRRVRQELARVLDGAQVRMADRPRLPYTTATVTELQRLANLVNVNLFHRVTQDVVVAGYPLKQGTTIVPQVSAVHLDPVNFPQPHLFDPTRFLDTTDPDNLKFVANEKVIPFGVDKRKCAGESLARTELFLIFCSIVQRFELSPATAQPPPLTANPHHFQLREPLDYEFRVAMAK